MNVFDYDLFDDAEDIPPLYDDYMYSPTFKYWDEEYEEEEDSDVSIEELFELCILPTLRDALAYIIRLLLWCFIFRLTTQVVKVPPLVCHAISAITGIIILNYFFDSLIYYILLFTAGAYVMLYMVTRFLKRNRGPILLIMSVIFLVACELFVVNDVQWHRIRGAQMLVAMKVISVAFDTDFGILQHLPSPVEFFGYVLCVGTCVFGPWVPYRSYIAIFERPTWNLRWLWKISLAMFCALMFLILSTCFIIWFIPDNTWKWWIAYRDAFSFRSSHYFISFLSEASAVTSGFAHDSDDQWSLTVVKPQLIEIPRSLVQVVVYWNVPMHNWLKTYVFRTTRPLGSLAAILSTYAVSSILHGLNFQLAAVLLSLGVYTYVEYLLRKKLAAVFGACIQVRPCKRECSHRNKEKKLAVVLVNIIFGIVSMFHLSYLGVMFDMSSELQEKGYNYTHTLSKWANLNFASHWVAATTYVFYFLI